MVKLEDIESIINELMDKNFKEKCSRNKIGGTGLRIGVNSKVRKALDDFRMETCVNRVKKKEKAILITNDGKRVASFNGDTHSVMIDNEKAWDLYHKYGELHMTYNHPSGKDSFLPTCLSENDCKQLSLNHHISFENGSESLYKSITAEAPNGTRMTLIRKDEQMYYQQPNNTVKFDEAVKSLSSDYKDYLLRYESEFIRQSGSFSGTDMMTMGAKKQYHENVIKEIGSPVEIFINARKKFNEIGLDLILEDNGGTVIL